MKGAVYELLTMYFYSSFIIPLLDPEIFLSILLSDTLNMYTSPRVNTLIVCHCDVDAGSNICLVLLSGREVSCISRRRLKSPDVGPGTWALAGRTDRPQRSHTHSCLQSRWAHPYIR